MEKKKILAVTSIGIFSGFINGLLGAGGGMIIVPMLTKFMGIERKLAHANAVFIIFVLCIVSSMLYIHSNIFSYHEVLPYLPLGIFGSILGSYMLPKIDKKVLRVMFGIFSIWAAFRLIVK